MTDAVDGLRRELDDLVKGREDWLDLLILRTPPNTSEGIWRDAIVALLADLRLDGVELELVPASGPPWIVDATFTDGWAP